MIGLAIERDRVRAVGVRRGCVEWGVESALDPTTPLGDALATFLCGLPTRRWPLRRLVPRVSVALGGAFAQTKRLGGLPPINDERVLAQTVHEHVGRFFLKNGAPLVTTTLRIDADGATWGAALDQTIVAAVESACRAARYRLRGVVPVADVVGRGLEVSDHGSVLWDEPGARVRLAWSHGRLATLARVADTEPAVVPGFAPPTVVPALGTLGTEAWRFAAAYGAALAGETPAGALTWRGSPASQTTVPRRRLALAAVAMGFGLVAALAAPELAARGAERRAVAHLVAVGAVLRVAERTQHDLGQVTGALGEMAAFRADARPVTLLMASLARVLPTGAVLVTVHVDSVGGSVVALAPRAAELVMRLGSVPGVMSAEIVSPLTREAAGGRELERATVRFRWRRP